MLLDIGMEVIGKIELQMWYLIEFGSSKMRGAL